MPASMQLVRPYSPPSRRLSDKILTAFEQACETGDLLTARELLGTLEVLLEHQPLQSGQERRRNIESLVEAHYRLFECRMANTGANPQQTNAAPT